MKKRRGISVLIVGIFSIILVTIVNFNRDTISEYLYKYLNKDNFVLPKTNDYYLDINYKFVSNYTDDISNKQELINYIFYVINSGSTYADGQCKEEYKNCINDLTEISNDAELLSNLNNYVHPYNSFKFIVFKSDNYGIFSIEVEHTYTKEQIDEINKSIEEFIGNNIDSKMTTVEKIKIIHDYIIKNTDYDSESNDSSKSAYGVLYNHRGICSGYADTISIFLNVLGIKNYKISNDTHIWNLIYVNGKWLHLDATWDDPISKDNDMSYTYFLIDTKKLMTLDDENHNFDKSIFKEAA